MKTRPSTANACVPAAEGGKIVAPRKIRDVSPLATAVEGTVVIEGRIGIDGFIRDMQVVGEAHPELVSAAMTAIRGWQYTQTLLNCTPVEPPITITTSFRNAPPPPPPPPPPPKPQA